MSDRTVAKTLRSDAPLVVVEAPAGCGKTHQGAEYARDVATASPGRVLIVTHTHAACNVFTERTAGVGRRVEIRTIDSLIAQVASAYHGGLGLPADIGAWTRRTPKGHAQLAARVARLVDRHPMVAAAIAVRYPTIICDEHQDSSGDQHAVVMALLRQGSRTRIFGDPMQHIYKEDQKSAASATCDWTMLLKGADACASLTTPHRWSGGCSELGRWTLEARATLKAGSQIDLTGALPRSVKVVLAENISQKAQGLRYSEGKPIFDVEKRAQSLLVLTRYNEATRSCRGMFYRRLPLWEGHTRSALEQLIDDLHAAQSDAATVAGATVRFLGKVGKGFTKKAFADRFEREAREGCLTACKGKPALLQELASFVVGQPDHRGVAVMLSKLYALRGSDPAFREIEIDHFSEYWDAVHLGRFDDVEAGLAELTNRRTFVRPKLPAKAISNIHKAKGLECGNVILMPVDAKTFPDKHDARCLLYVALSRAKDGLTIVASKANPSPLLRV